VTHIDDHLVKVIADIAVFLEFTNPELLDEDAAVGAMEQIARELQQMAEADQKELTRKFVALAFAYNGAQREFIEGRPKAMGLD
jgi:hypothetical protein